MIEDIDPMLQVLPEALDRVQLGTVRGQPSQDDVFRDRDAPRHLGRSLIQEDNVQPLGIVLTKFVQQEIETVGIEAGPLPPEGVAGGGLDRRRQPIRLVQGLDHLYRLHAVACEPPMDRQVQTEACFILAEDPYRLVGRLPASGRDRPEAAGALFDQVSRLGDVFLAWLGRGRLRLAWSW
jgi:hypothetical protein